MRRDAVATAGPLRSREEKKPMAKRYHLAMWTTAGALALVPAIASGEPPPEGQAPPDQPAPAGQGTKGAEGTKGTEGTTAAEGTKGAETTKGEAFDKPIRLDETIAVPLEGGCVYNATLKGTITPTKAKAKQAEKKSEGQGSAGKQGGEGQQAEKQGEGHQAEKAKADEQRFNPNVTVGVVMTCPSTADLKLADIVVRNTGPITKSELEDTLEVRSSVVHSKDGQRCIYMPDFELTTTTMTASSVAMLCPVTAGEGGKAKGTK